MFELDDAERTHGDEPKMSKGVHNSQSMRALVKLRELLLKGSFEPGERLLELKLVDLLGVSRSPVRLALARLEHEGLLEARHGGGYFARAFSPDDLSDAIELRGVLEGTAARRAAERGGDASILARMHACSDEMEAIVDAGADSMDGLSRYVELNDDFHNALLELCGSPVVQRAHRHALALPFAAPSAFVMEGRQRAMFVVAQSQHRELLDAIERREGTRAENIGREHARLAARSLQRKLVQLRQDDVRWLIDSVPNEKRGAEG